MTILDKFHCIYSVLALNDMVCINNYCTVHKSGTDPCAVTAAQHTVQEEPAARQTSLLQIRTYTQYYHAVLPLVGPLRLLCCEQCGNCSRLPCDKECAAKHREPADKCYIGWPCLESCLGTNEAIDYGYEASASSWQTMFASSGDFTKAWTSFVKYQPTTKFSQCGAAKRPKKDCIPASALGITKAYQCDET